MGTCFPVTGSQLLGASVDWKVTALIPDEPHKVSRSVTRIVPDNWTNSWSVVLAEGRGKDMDGSKGRRQFYSLHEPYVTVGQKKKG